MIRENASIVSLFPGAVTVATAAGRIMEITGLPLEERKDSVKADKMEKSANERRKRLCHNKEEKR